jgi:hypothetical protein
MIVHSTISWSSKLQKSVALSTTESEFVAGSEGAKELVWLTRLFNEICSTKIRQPNLYILITRNTISQELGVP